jgi:hypothetical protein
MTWISINDHPSDFSGRTLLLPSCGASNVDQLCLDVLCFNFGTLVGRLLSRNLEFVASRDPFSETSNVLSSSIDVYSCELPLFGPSVLLRVSAGLPAAKRQILDYSKELAEFAGRSNIARIVLVRSVASVFCVDTQLQEWPLVVRGVGTFPGPLKIKPLEEYGETQEMIRWAVRGELLECLTRFSPVPFAAVLMFDDDPSRAESAVAFARLIGGREELRVPPAWALLIGAE